MQTNSHKQKTIRSRKPLPWGAMQAKGKNGQWERVSKEWQNA